MKILSELCRDIGAEVAGGNLNGALVKLANVVDSVVHDDRSVAKVFSSPALDQLCKDIGYRAMANLGDDGGRPYLSDGAPVVIVASEVYSFGGHTRVIEDFINNSEGKEGAVVLLTNLFGAAVEKLQDPAALRAKAKILVAPDVNLYEKLVWLRRMLRDLAPKRVYFFHHHQDSAAVAAMLGCNPENAFCIHHGDHQLSLGMHIPDVTHVDIHNFGYFYCRNNLGIEGNLYWPLVAEDRGFSENRPFMSTGGLVTATCGNANKFIRPYPFSYISLVPALIAASKGRHVHIGSLPGDVVDNIRAGLAARGIEGDRFVHIEWVPSLWDALRELGVDWYLNSFPAGGGKAVIEAMGSGTPVIAHSHLKSSVLSCAELIYREAPTWQNFDDLLEIIESTTPGLLAQQSSAARSHYLKHNHPDILKLCLKLGRGSAEGGVVPAPLARSVEPLQAFWNEVG